MTAQKEITRAKIRELAKIMSDVNPAGLSMKQMALVLAALIKYDEWEYGPE